MKVIFLDIDGVLNSDIWYKKQAAQKKASMNLNDHLDKEAIRLLNKIITQTNANVVLSSTWRKHYALEEIQAIFDNKGFLGHIIAKTPDLVGMNEYFTRGNEILKWCKENEALLGKKYVDFKEYVILDDKDDMLYWQRNNFFLMDRFCGLTPSQTTRIIKFLSL